MDRILYIIDTLQTGGAERSTLEIASRLKTFQPVLCQVYQKDELSDDYQESPIIFENLGLTGKYEFSKANSLLRAVIKKHRPVLVIATLMRAEIIARIVCKQENIPILGTFVNDTYAKEALEFVPLSLRLKIRFFQILNAYTARYCSAFIANSLAIKASNVKALRIDAQKVRVIHRGRDVSKFEAVTGNRTSPPFHFVNVGRLLERKGQLDLIKAFGIYDKKMPGSTLTIAGEGPFRDSLQQVINELELQGKVRLPGNMVNIPAFLQEADCFVFPSYYEGFSGALLEAALCGLPVIASDIPMNKEVIREESCTYYPVKDEHELANKMLQFSEMAADCVSKASSFRKEAMRKYDIENIVAEHESMYVQYATTKNLLPA